MPSYALTFGALLIGLGLIGYFGAGESNKPTNEANQAKKSADKSDDANKKSDDADKSAKSSEAKSKSSRTALIPAAFGILLVMCGTLGLQKEWRKHAMHVAAAIALLGALASLGRLAMKIGPWISGDPSVNGRAMFFLIMMGVLCAVYVGLSVYSFIAARKAREAAESVNKSEP